MNRTTSIQTDFPLLKEYGAFLMAHRLQETSVDYLNILRGSALSILDLFIHLPEEQLLQTCKKLLEPYFQQLMQGNALEQAKLNIQQWQAGEHPVIPKDKITAPDIALIYHSRKKLLLNFLLQFTRDPEKLVALAIEIEDLYTQVEQFAFQTFLAVKNEELFTSNKLLQQQREELEATNEELEASQEELKEANATLEKRVEERTRELRSSEEQMRLITDSLPVLITYVDREERYRFNNKTYEKWFNYNRSEVYGKKLQEVMGDAAYEKVKDTVHRALNGEPMYLETEVHYKAAGKKHISASYIPHIEDGKVEGYFALITDISGRKTTEEALQQANEQISNLLEREKIAYAEAAAQRNRLYNLFMQAPSWLCILRGENFVFELANPHYLEAVGTDTPIDGKTVQEVIPDMQPEVLEALKYAYHNGKRIVANEFPIVSDWHKNGNPFARYFNQIYEPIKEADGTTSGLIVFGYEVTAHVNDRHKIEKNAALMQRMNQELSLKNEELSKINNDLDNFIYTASHDLKSPVLNLDGLINILKTRLNGAINSENQNIIDMMHKSAEKLKKTIGDLTEITKAQKDLEEATVDISFEELMNEVKADIEKEIEDANPVFQEDFQVQYIRYGKRNLRSILYNLLTNALKYRSPKRPLQLEIKTFRDENCTVLSFSDNGLGVSQQQVPKLFTMFKRLHSHVEGTGIGLYIVKRIVENHGGRIEVESELNKGTTFRVYLTSPS